MTWSSGRAIAMQALWFGLLTGLCEAGLVAIKYAVLGRIVRVGPDLIWMAPLADALLFLAIALVLIAGARLWKPIGEPAVTTFVFAFFAFLSVLLMYYPIEMYAKVLLAIGLGVQASRLAGRWRTGFGWLVKRGVVAMIAITLVLALLARVAPALAYQRRVAALPSAASDAPNVLLIVWDTVRARNLSVYGYERRTAPNLETWASSSTVFENASATSPWTLPSHASMFTGRWPQELSANWEQPLDETQRTLGEALAERGYLTAGFVANTYYCGNELGLARGFAHYEDYVVSPQELLISSTFVRVLANSHTTRHLVGYEDNIPRRTATAITDQFLRWQSSTGDRPFFAFLNFFDAHETYLPPAPFAGRFGPGPTMGSPEVIQDVRRSLRRDWPQRSREDIQGELNMYDGAIAYLDDQLNRLLVELRVRGKLDNTIVIITADHGEQFGEHQLFLHGNSLYQPLLHVPLVIRFPGRVPAGIRVASRVTLRDLAATIIDFAGLKNDTGLPGESLARYWPGTSVADGADAAIAEVREAEWAKQVAPSYPVAKGNMESISDDRFHYIKNGDGSEELYAIADDRDERNDLSQRLENAAVLELYRKALRSSLAGGGR
jgi:arylsulfatase A-like enzyme